MGRTPRSRSVSRSRSRSVHSRSRSRSRSRSYKSRSLSRSRSRTPPRQKRKKYYHSRSRSRSRSRSPRGRRSSPQSFRNNRRNLGNRENPPEGKCLGVFGLSLYTSEREVREAFDRFGHVDDVQVVYDHATGKSRGFAFVYMRSTDEAADAKETLNGQELDGRRIRVDYSITQRAHTPTPGVYMGKPSTRGYRGSKPSYEERGGGSGGRRRSYSRSRSRSRSPRRW